jgi:exonuclease III
VLVKKDKFNLVRGVTYDIPRVSGTTTLLSPAASTSSSSTSSSSKQKAKKTTPALTSFFKAVPSPKEASSPPAKKQRLAGPKKHDSEGRVILLELPDFFILHCYVPNNGGNQASFERRQLWDKKVQDFFTKVKEDGGWKGEGGKMKEVRTEKGAQEPSLR